MPKHIFSVNKLKILEILTVSVYIIGFVSLFFIQFDIWLFFLTMLMYFLLFGFGVSMTLHRSLTHKAIKLHPIVEIVGKFFASMGGTGSPISWVLIHRAHHRYSDKDKDPHSAKDISNYIVGKYPSVSSRGIRELSNSKFNRFMHRYYYSIILAYGAFWSMLGADLFCYGFVYPMILNMFAGHIINWYSHSNFPFNYRIHKTQDNSNNNIVIAMLTWGEGFHNTHHRYSKRANFAVYPWEIDITYIFALFLRKIGLASF